MTGMKGTGKRSEGGRRGWEGLNSTISLLWLFGCSCGSRSMSHVILSHMAVPAPRLKTLVQ